MKKTLIALVLLAFVSGIDGSAFAQTRVGVGAGVLVPTGDMGDSFDSSPWFGARLEYQPTNPLGQVATIGLFAQVAYSDLQTASALEDQLVDLGMDTSSSYLEGGVGARFYTIALPVFVSASANFAKLESGGADDTAFAPAVGIGMNFGLGGIFIEGEVAGHAFMGDGDTQSFVTLAVAAGLPF